MGACGQAGSAMLMASFSDSVKEELLASRLNGTLAILARALVLYRPGSVVEGQQVLASLESPPPMRQMPMRPWLP